MFTGGIDLIDEFGNVSRCKCCKEVEQNEERQLSCMGVHTEDNDTGNDDRLAKPSCSRE